MVLIVSSGTVLDAELLFWLRQHRGRRAVFSAAFHHAERAPRVTSSLTAESPTIRSFQTILGVDTRTLATRALRARKTRKLPSPATSGKCEQTFSSANDSLGLIATPSVTTLSKLWNA